MVTGAVKAWLLRIAVVGLSASVLVQSSSPASARRAYSRRRRRPQIVASPVPVPTPTPTPPPTPTPTPTPAPQRWVSPEGTVIEINSIGGWTVDQIYQLLKENGLDSSIGPTLTIDVQDVYGSQTAPSAGTTNGRYTYFAAIVYLKGTDSGFALQPDATVGHEFGHVWTLYHLYLSQQGDWSSYLNARGIAGDPRLDSSYVWSPMEIIADDYRLLFGSAAAISERPTHMNPDLPDPRNVPGLRDFFVNYWAVAH